MHMYTLVITVQHVMMMSCATSTLLAAEGDRIRILHTQQSLQATVNRLSQSLSLAASPYTSWSYLKPAHTSAFQPFQQRLNLLGLSI
jgi:hypothetical protein